MNFWATVSAAVFSEVNRYLEYIELMCIIIISNHNIVHVDDRVIPRL